MPRTNRLPPLLISAVAFIALWFLIPRLKLFGLVPDTIMFTTVFMAVQILIVRIICSAQMKFASAGIAFLVFLAAFGTLLIAAAALKNPAYIALPLDLSRIAAAAFLGYIVSFVLRDRNIILPIAIFAAFLDIVVVTWGSTRYFLTVAPEIVQQVSAPIPVPGGHGRPMSFIGPADFVFLAVFFGALYRLKMEPRRTYWLLVALLPTAMLAVILLPFFTIGLPGLVPMSIGVIAANYRHFKLRKQEKISVAVVSLLLSLSLAAFLMFRAAH